MLKEGTRADLIAQKNGATGKEIDAIWNCSLFFTNTYFAQIGKFCI